MEAPTPLVDIVRFGIFQLDLRARELLKAGRKVKLQDQPFRVLVLLVAQAGKVVTREELRQAIWPSDVYVTFDQGLNNAIRKVRDALEDSADNPRFIETVAKQGYRFIAPVNPVQPLPPEPPQQSGSRSMRKAALIGSSATLLLAALVYWTWHRPVTRALPSSEKAVLAVLPFDNLSHDPDQDFFAVGLTEEITAQLSKLNPERLSVIARGSAVKYKGSSMAPGQIGKELHADYLLQGSVRRAPGRVRITVHLIQASDQIDLWAESYDNELKDILALQDSLARTVANQIHITLTADARLATVRQLDPVAYEAYLKGRFYWNKRTGEDMDLASTYFQQAINRDPAYGAAYSGLADSNSGLAWHGFKSPAEALPKAHAAALKAIETNPQSAEAHASLALILDHKLDWPAAETEFKRALQLDPRYANAHHWYGDYLSIKGRHNEALAEAQKALELDPVNLMIGTWLGLRYYFARKYDRAVEQARNTVALDPNFAAAHLVLGESYVQVGAHEQGLAELRKAASLSGNSPLYLAQVAIAQASAGRKPEALQIVRQLQKFSSDRYVSPYGLAQIYAALNDKEQTFKWLETAYEDHSVWMSYLAVDPVFDRFRTDPRFHDLLRRLALLS